MFDYCIYFNTAVLARQLESKWTQAFKPFGLTPPQAFMLRAILDKPGLLQREIAQLLAISRPTTTRLLDGLEAKKLIKREGLALDGRASHIFPTAKALGIQAQLNKASNAVTNRFKTLLGTEKFQTIVANIKTVILALE